VRWAVLGGVALVCSCSLLTNLDVLGAGDAGDGAPDVLADIVATDVDAGMRCDKDAAFGAPTPVTELEDQNGGGGEFGARLTADELDVFYSHIQSGGAVIRTYSAHRASRTDPFGAPSEVLAVRGTGIVDAFPSVDGAGLVYFVQSDSDGSTGFGVFSASRGVRTAQFGALQLVAALETPVFEGNPYVAPDGAELFFVRGDAGSVGPTLIFSAAFNGSSYANDTPVQGVNAPGYRNRTPVITSDRLTMYFASDRKDGGDDDIWRAARTSPSTVFGSATLVSELATSGDDVPSWISPDECVMYLARKTMNMQHVYRAVRP
jgi:hypothetical protein